MELCTLHSKSVRFKLPLKRGPDWRADSLLDHHFTQPSSVKRGWPSLKSGL